MTVKWNGFTRTFKFKLSDGNLVCVHICVCWCACVSLAVAVNDAPKSQEPRAPLAEMEDIEVKKKKEKPAAVHCLLCIVFTRYY